MTRLPDGRIAPKPRQLLSEREINQQRMLEDQADPGLYGMLGHAANSDHLMPWLLNALERDGLPDDPNFKGVFADDKLAQAMTKDLAPDYWEELLDARSLQEAQIIRRRLLDVQESRRQLEQMGYGGVALRMGASLLDPAAFAVGALTGGGSFIAQGSTRLARMGRAGLVASASNLPVDAALNDLDPTMGVSDVAVGAVASFVLGGGVGALIPAARKAKLVRDAELEAAFGGPSQAMGSASRFELSPEGREMNAGVPGNIEQWKADANEFLDAVDANVDSAPNLDVMIDQALDVGDFRRALEDAIHILDGDQVTIKGLETLRKRASENPGGWQAEHLARIESLIASAKNYTGKKSGAPVTASGLLSGGNAGVPSDLAKNVPAPDELNALKAQHAARLVDAADPDPEIREVFDKLSPDEIIARYTTPVEEYDAPGRAAAGKAEAARIKAERAGKTDDDLNVEARTAQILEENPALDQGVARSTAEAQIKAEDAAAQGDGPKPPKPPAEPPQPPEIEVPPSRGDEFKPVISGNKALYGRARISAIGRIKNSDSQEMRVAASMAGDDRAIRAAEGELASDSMTAAARRRRHAAKAPVAQEYWPAFKEFEAAAKRNGKRPEDGDYLAWFGRLVSDGIESGDMDEWAVKPVQKAAKAIQNGYADQLGWAKRHGHQWALRVQENANYLTRIWKKHELRRVEAAKGRNYLVNNIIAPAMTAFADEADPNIPRKAAMNLVDRILSDDFGDIDLARIIGGDPEAMREFLDSIDGVSAEAKDRIINNLAQQPKDSTPGNFRFRTALDHDWKYVDPDTKEEFRLKDFFERNAFAVYDRYVTNTTGSVIERTYLNTMGKYASDLEGREVEFKSWEQMTSWLKKRAEANPKADRGALGFRGKIQRDLDRLETLRRYVRGMPLKVGSIDSTSDVAAALRNLRSLATIQRSGGFGFAAATETGTALGEFGISTVLRRMPEAAKITRAMMTGKASNEMLQSLEILGVNPGDLMIRRIVTHLDPESGVSLSRTSQRIQRLTNTALNVSGMPYVDAYSRVLTVLCGMDKFAQQAHKFVKDGKSLDAYWFAELGMSPAQAQRLLKGLSSDGVLVTYDGSLGRKVKRIDLDKLSQVAGSDAVHDLVVGMDRIAVRTIQTNDIALEPRFLQGEAAKVITQFRRFVVNAYETHTLRRIYGMAHGRFDAYAAVVLGSVVGGLVYAGQTYVNSLGMEKKAAEKFRSERLTWLEIGKSGFARTGVSSTLPAVLDNISLIVQGGPIFSHARFTELNPAGLFQNPTSANMQAIGKTAQTGFETVFRPNDRITKSEAQAFFSLLPFRNVVGVRNVLDAISSRLPERELPR